MSAHWIADRQSGPLILKYGTDAQRDFFLPKICAASAFFCIGMSEPQSGSDLAGLRTRATRSAEGWVLKGQKLWTTNAHRAQYMIALVRTHGSPEDRHAGLSQMIVDLSLPGITVRTIGDLAGDAHFNEVFFDDVLLPHDALVGEEGAGWAQVTAELAYERSGPERIYGSIVLFDAWLEHLRSQPRASDADVMLAGKLLAHLAPLREMSLALTARLAEGASPVIEAALVKDLGTEFEQALPNLLADALYAAPDDAPPDMLLRTLHYVLQVVPDLLAARRHARDPARRDRPWAGAALMDTLLVESFEKLLQGACTPAIVREVERTADASALWATIESSGYLDLLVPGEGGAGLRDAFPLWLACGAHTLPVPLAQTMWARGVLGAGAGAGAIAIAPIGAAPRPTAAGTAPACPSARWRSRCCCTRPTGCVACRWPRPRCSAVACTAACRPTSC